MATIISQLEHLIAAWNIMNYAYGVSASAEP